MFGHDNQDNNNGGGQITLPQTDAAPHEETHVDQPVQEPTEANAVNHRAVEKSGAPTDDLLDIKQEALQALTPLVNHLDQTPEERFRTTMMMIQASDNHGLIKTAYDAAKHITNEKERAQALLDIVNEINYFTQHNQAA